MEGGRQDLGLLRKTFGARCGLEVLFELGGLSEAELAVIPQVLEPHVLRLGRHVEERHDAVVGEEIGVISPTSPGSSRDQGVGPGVRPFMYPPSD